MKKRLYGLIILAFLPLICQLIADHFQSYGIGLILRILSHIIIPVIAVAYITKISFKESFFLPIHLKNKKQTFQLALIGSLGATAIILTAFFSLKHLIDLTAISTNLATINITPITYPLIALAIVLINPFIEEYFWRGFVFRVFDKYTKFGYWTGILFALHHVIIIAGWFNWWQFILVTVFLALVGILFNWTYKKTNSIYATWITHLIADLVIVTIGYFYIFQ
ncbi:CPBP family intramembrane metalloprotease [archaeon]|jgi:uncharacterized protein|nr:CPBP family intramembrane metalloprotease [archaeon]